MVSCDYPDCDELVNYMPFRCKYCGRQFCKKHRLPENHGCTFEFRAPSATPDSSKISKAAPETYMPKTTPIPGPDKTPVPPSISASFPTPPPPPRDYDRTEERTRRISLPPPPVRSRRNVDDRPHRPWISPSENMNATYTIMLLNFLLFFVSLFVPELIYLNLLTLTQKYYIWTPFTALFTPDNILSLLFSEIIFYQLGRTFERRFGPKFFVSLYVVAGLCTELAALLLELLGLLSYPLIFLTYAFTTANSGIFVGFIAFFAFFAGMETQMTFYLYFIPVRLKAKHILWFIIGFNLLFTIIGLVEGLSGDLSAGYTVVGNLSSLAGILGAKLIFNTMRSRGYVVSMMNRFF